MSRDVVAWLVAAVDAGVPGELASLLRQASELGSVDQVIYAAGARSEAEAFYTELTASDLSRHLQVLAGGGAALVDSVREGLARRAIVCSSIAGELGGVGMAAYGAAHAYMDRVIENAQGEGLPLDLVSFDNWESVTASDGGRLVTDLLWELIDSPGQRRLFVAAGDLDEKARDWRTRPESRPAAGRSSPPDMARRKAYRAPTTSREVLVARIWEDALGFDQLGLDDHFVDLGGDSLLALHIAEELQKHVAGLIHVRALFEAPTIGALAAYLDANYPDEALPSGEAAASPLTGQMLVRYEAYTPHFPLAPRAARTRNRRAAFVLCTPRTGSTLLRVMLAGHSKIFAPPELELANFNTMAERASFAAVDGTMFGGLTAAVMNLCDLDAAEAAASLSGFAQAGTNEMFAALQDWCGERLLVDKTPAYAGHQDNLQRLEQDFEEALYIHLVRHPAASIESYCEARLDLLDHDHIRSGRGLTLRQTAEAAWTVGHRNIVDFLERIPAERQVQMRFEDLVADPDLASRRMAAFLGLEFEPIVADPYVPAPHRILGGEHEGSRMVGDPKLPTFDRVRPEIGERWRGEPTATFNELTISLARRFGYAVEDARPEDSGEIEAIQAMLARIEEMTDDEAAEHLERLDLLGTQHLAPAESNI